MNFSQRLKQLREERKITQEDLAASLGLSRSTIAGYEAKNREPDFGTLNKIASFFDVSVDFLVGRTNIRNPYIPDDYQHKYTITKRDLKQYEDFIQHANTFFMNDEVSEEDKEALFRDISELFWKSKEKNKQKYGRKKPKDETKD